MRLPSQGRHSEGRSRILSSLSSMPSLRPLPDIRQLDVPESCHSRGHEVRSTRQSSRCLGRIETRGGPSVAIVGLPALGMERKIHEGCSQAETNQTEIADNEQRPNQGKLETVCRKGQGEVGSFDR